MVTIYTITYNEEAMIEFFIQHYRKLFPRCEINIFDNFSTDNTIEIAKKYGCIIHFYDTNNQLSDTTYLEIKNNCWKKSKTDWVIICDCDELIEIDSNELKVEIKNKVSLMKFEGYTMMSFNKDINLGLMDMAYRDPTFDKTVLFNRRVIKEINFTVGSHNCSPVPYEGKKINYSKKNYRLLHYKFLNPEYTIERFKLFNSRLSDLNKKNNWGFHYTWSPEKINEFYKQKEKELIKIK
jgi:glycosyltransferase involved in cell wall biosynthesis